MGQHTPRTAAEEIADALADLASARAALDTVLSQLDDLTANEQTAPTAHQARRNARIAAAELASAERHVRESNRLQLNVVS
jgi:hypothetical protein